MTRPTKHPKTGVWRIRIAIPDHLRAITQRRYGKRSAFIETLGTKDGAEAKRRAAAVIQKLQAQLAAAQAEHDDRPETLTDRQVAGLAGQYAALRARQDEDHTPATASNWEVEIDFLRDVEGWFAGDEETTTSFKEARACVADGLDAVLAEAGLHVDDDSIRRLVARCVTLERHHLQDLAERQTSGRWRRSYEPSDFPAFERPNASKAAPKPVEGSTLDALLERWALDRGFHINAKPVSRALYDRIRTIERLATFLGHRDASRVTKANAVAWKDAMQRGGSHASTVRNDLSEMSAIWKTAIANDLATENPFAGIAPPKAKQQKQSRRAFTDDEAARIIEASRNEKGALRWLPIVLCLTGARLNEVSQAVKEDVQLVDGVNILRIHDEGDGRSVKNADSRRSVPMHPALVAEGFLDYVAALPRHSTLWPDIAPDGTFGQRGPKASRLVSRWLRKQGLTDPAISPSHSWRHWFMDACRRVVMPMEVRSSITGQSAKLDEGASYGHGMGTMLQVLASYMAKVHAPSACASGERSAAA